MIDVDLADLMPHELLGILSPATVEAALDSLAASARIKWVRAAQTELRSSRQAYIRGISEIGSRSGVRFIVLEGWLANAVENGLDPWDLRDTVLHGPAAKVSEDGNLYVSVPFRHGTPGTTGLVGAAMGSSYGPRGTKSLAAGGQLDADRAAQFGKDLYQAAKRLRTRTKGRSARAMGEAIVQNAYRAAGGSGSPLLAPHHKTSIYAGMRRERKPYVSKTGRQTTQSQYTTFRTISEGGDPGSWWHPGIRARNLSEQVTAHVERIVPAIVRKAIAAASKGA